MFVPFYTHAHTLKKKKNCTCHRVVDVMNGRSLHSNFQFFMPCRIEVTSLATLEA
jgi:hypothetical protein